MKLLLVLGVGLMSIVAYANPTTRPCRIDHSTMVTSSWRLSAAIALRLPSDSSEEFGEGAGHSAILWETKWGRLRADYTQGPLQDWATNVKVVCKTKIDGRNARIVRYRKWGEQRFVALYVPHAPLGSLLVSVPQQTDEADAATIDALLSLRFINDPSKLVVTKAKSEQDAASVLVTNEIGVQRTAQVGDSITNRMGTIKEIRNDVIVVDEYDGRAWKKVLIPIKRSAVGQVSDPPRRGG